MAKTPKRKVEIPVGLDDDWKVDNFLKDATYFAVEFGLPNKGENAFKITDISDEALLIFFLRQDWNGFKVAPSMNLIPFKDIIHLRVGC